MRSIRLLGRALVLSVVLVLALVASGCSDGSSAGEGGLVGVTASFYPLAEAAERVGGDNADVTNLTPPGAEPHDIDLSPRQVDRLVDSDVVVYLGGGFQPSVEEIADRVDGVAVDVLGGDDVDDPHVWLDPRRMVDIVEQVRDGFIEVDGAHAARYRRRASEYVGSLEALDRDLAAGLSQCERRTIVTAHAAFGHLAARYDLEERSVAGLSPTAEPDPRRLDELIDLVREEGVTTVFTETLVPADIAETLAREAGVTVDVLNPLEGLTDDELERGETYESVMRQNLSALQRALGCEPVS